MQGEFSLHLENDLLVLMKKAIAIDDLKALLSLIVNESIGILDAKECWIYLQPKYVPEYRYSSLNKKTYDRETTITQGEKDFVVLAATSTESGFPEIGKEYFVSGEGVIGWVYRNLRTISISNAKSKEDLRRIYPELSLDSKHQEGNDFGQSDKVHPLLIMPLVLDGKPLGVLKYLRDIGGNTFSRTSEEIVSVICNTLATSIGHIYSHRQTKRMLMTLAHEINTPLTGILADSENIYTEASTDSELQMMAKHNLEQVLRLHMQTSTIMSVLSEEDPVRQFSEHSIYRPLIEACELFKSEALLKGCDIVGPTAREGSFPKIEMSLFDLTIAFKNIIHNAVKYSFRPPENLSIHRTIKVWGQNDREREGYYSVYVQNYGVGITKSEIETKLIFKPYIRGERASDRRRIGAGFGLAHAKMVIEDLHKGFIDVDSIHQGGEAYLTTFKISLPIKHPN